MEVADEVRVVIDFQNFVSYTTQFPVNQVVQTDTVSSVLKELMCTKKTKN
jgi:hypothetical protein